MDRRQLAQVLQATAITGISCHRGPSRTGLLGFGEDLGVGPSWCLALRALPMGLAWGKSCDLGLAPYPLLLPFFMSTWFQVIPRERTSLFWGDYNPCPLAGGWMRIRPELPSPCPVLTTPRPTLAAPHCRIRQQETETPV